MTLDYVPYIGRYSPALPQVLVATGFCLWGMTTSQVAAGLLADAVEGKPNPYAAFFTPHRSLLHPQLFANLGATLGDFLIPTRAALPASRLRAPLQPRRALLGLPLSRVAL